MMDSAVSWFLIMHEDALFLEGNDVALGKVTSGQDVVDAIAEVQTAQTTGQPNPG